MYEPEKILVQNAGIDPGVAALLQNANKGNMDPAALMAMMNNGGFGGNGGWWWIWIILIFFCWGGFGGNGFGRGSDDASRLASQLNTDTNTSLLMQAIQGNKDAISSLSNTLNCDINAVQTALNTINTSVSQIACDTKLASCEVINAITSNNTVTYGICPFQWRQLPCRGLILLNINHTATGATEGSLVSVATSVSSSQVSSNPTSVNTNSGKALLNGSGDQMPTEEISIGNKYLIYYDKRTGVFQTINHIVAPAA